MAQKTIAAPTDGEQRLPMTYEEYLDWAGEDIRAEWVDGEAIIFMPITFEHQLLVAFLNRLLGLFVQLFVPGDIGLGPAQMRLRGGRSAREPDLFFLAAAHRDRRTRLGIEGPADLVIEIISDDSVSRDRVAKLAEYEAAGVPEYWVFDPRSGRHDARFYRLTDAGTYFEAAPDVDGRFHSGVLPGFWLNPAWLWQDPLPDPLALLKRIAPDALRAFIFAADEDPEAEEGDA